MRIRLGKMVFVAVFIFFGMASVTIMALAMNVSVPVVGRYVMEVGTDFPPPEVFLTVEAREKNTEIEYITDISAFNQHMRLGAYEIELLVGKKSYISVLEVVDTNPPAGLFVSRVVFLGEQPKSADFVRDIQDTTSVTVSFDNEPDFNTPGACAIWVCLTDEGGNQTRIYGYVYVISGVRTIDVELAYLPGYLPDTSEPLLEPSSESLSELSSEFSPEFPLELSDFIYNEADRSSAAFITDISTIDWSIPGQVKLDVWIKETTAAFYVNITDTTPPTAAPIPATAYKGQVKWPWDFVTEVYDASPVDYFFTEMPDWNTYGEQTVLVLLRDAFGNETEIASTLYVIEDKDPPMFFGLETKYVSLGGTVAYRKDVTAYDTCDGEVSFTVDSSGVDVFSEGTYIVSYEAVDLSGNVGTADVRVVVTSIDPEIVYAMASEVLAQILRDDMTTYEIGSAIYNWVKSSVHYVSSGEKVDVIKGAYNGLKLGYGDCYTYYALSTVMLNLCGIPNYGLERSGGSTRHYWSLVNTGDGWYHFDSCPYKEVFNGYMFTESQARAYTSTRGRNYYVYDYDSLPEHVVVVWE